MTTLAIIGGGIVGRSLLYTLAKEQKRFEKVTLFSSDNITLPCSLNSTAVAALRGTVKGLSPLGDQIFEGHALLREHVEQDRPQGVERIRQFSAASEKLESFLKRHPAARLTRRFFTEETYMDEEEAFLFDPRSYLQWLLERAQTSGQYELEVLQDMVIDIQETERVSIHTLSGRNLSFDRLVVAGGSYNGFWKPLASDSKLKTSRPVPGSYLEYSDILWQEDSFSLSVNGHNIIWNKPYQRLLIGSTTTDDFHYLPRITDLKHIHSELTRLTTINLPAFESADVKTGLREKAQKREPYVVMKGKVSFIGGMYKSAFGLSLAISRNLTHQLL